MTRHAATFLRLRRRCDDNRIVGRVRSAVLDVRQRVSSLFNSVTRALFVCALAALIGGLTCFLREVYLATESISIETARFEERLRER